MLLKGLVWRKVVISFGAGICVKVEALWRKERGEVFATGDVEDGVKLGREKRNVPRTKSWGGEGEEKDQCRFVALSIRNCYRACRL